VDAVTANVDTANAVNRAHKWMDKDFSIPFQITDNNKYLFQIKLLKITADTHYCYAKIHHIIGDGWSFKLLLNQLASIYNDLSAGTTPAIQQYRYSDYVLDDAAYQQSVLAADDQQFWLGEYEIHPPELFKKNEPHSNDDAPAGTATLFVPAALKQQLHAVAAENKSSVFQVIMSLILVYFARTRQVDKIAAALPVLNRPKKVYKHTAGVFMNLICPVFNIDTEHSLPKLLHEIRTKMYTCLKHQRYQYGNLVKDLLTAHAGKPVYQLRVSYEDFDFNAPFQGITTSTTALSNHFEIEPLSVYIRDYNDQGFDVRLIYNKDYFNADMIANISMALMNLMSEITSLLHTPIAEWPVLVKEEKEQILSFSRGRRNNWPYKTYIDLWRDTVKSYPDNIAVSAGQDHFSYRVIDLKVSALTNSLLHNTSYRQGETIALLLPRNASMVIGMLGCMHAGVAFMPIDPEEPVGRIYNFLKSGDCRKLIVSGDLLNDVNWSDVEMIRMESLTINNEPASVQEVSPVEGCYVIHTSGSTGTPKAVAVSHQSFINYVCHFQQYFSLTAQDVVLQHAAVSFDIAMEEIFPILGVGGRLCILEDRKNIKKIIDVLEQEKISIISSTPLVLKHLNEQLDRTALRLVISGGDVLRPAYIDQFIARNLPVYNTYGPTECTICATYHQVDKEETGIAIGKPITNCDVYILNNQGGLQPAGVEGEICIGGAGVAIGYINDPALTKEKFIDHELAPNGKIYRTGDTGRYTTAGILEYTGRNDAQLKVRGIRIEPGEIERAIMEYPGVRTAIVMAVQEPVYGKIPVAFVIFDTEENNASQLHALRTFLRGRLPEYMMPGKTIPVTDIPLNTQGKPDKAALIHLMQTDTPIREYTTLASPANPTEQTLMEIWINILEMTDISVTDNFFDLGGHSLKAAALVTAIYERFDVDISIAEIFAAPTIQQLSDLISQHENSQYEYVELC
jgi:amino acid adenylation domain-containing protein